MKSVKIESKKYTNMSDQMNIRLLLVSKSQLYTCVPKNVECSEKEIINFKITFTGNIGLVASQIDLELDPSFCKLSLQ